MADMEHMTLKPSECGGLHYLGPDGYVKIKAADTITDERLAELESFTQRFFAEFRAKREKDKIMAFVKAGGDQPTLVDTIRTKQEAAAKAMQERDLGTDEIHPAYLAPFLVDQPTMASGVLPEHKRPLTEEEVEVGKRILASLPGAEVDQPTIVPKE